MSITRRLIPAYAALCVALAFFLVYEATRDQNEYRQKLDIYSSSQQEWTWNSTALLLEHNRLLDLLEQYSRNEGAIVNSDVLERFEIYWSRYSALISFYSAHYNKLRSVLLQNPRVLGMLNQLKADAEQLNQKGMSVLTKIEDKLLMLELGNQSQYNEIYMTLSTLTSDINNLQIGAFNLFRDLNNFRKLSHETITQRITFLSVAVMLSAVLGFLLFIYHLLQKNRATSTLQRVNQQLTKEIGESARLAQKLDKLAHHDSLSGLLNRQGISRILDSNAESSGSHGLCFIDLDLFKVVNDTCGHAAGDTLIRNISKLLTNIAPENAFVARYGGDEFLIFWPDSREDEFTNIIEACCKAMSPYNFAYDSQAFEVTASLGAAHFDFSNYSVDSILACVDSACYEAKRLGGSKVRYYSEKSNSLQARQTDLNWIPQIQRCLNEDSFVLFYQPINQLIPNQTIPHSWELLIRMPDENENYIPPGVFLDVAERFGLAPRIDKWVVEKSLEWLCSNDLSALGLECLNVNLSGLSLNDDDFISEIGQKVLDAKIDPTLLCLEVTETSVIEQKARSNLDKLKKVGVRLALDDFGSGFSSFGYLESLPVDYIKIDGMFVKDIDTNNTHFEFVRAIDAVGKSMNLKVVAEFVENQQSIERLREIGVDLVQGYHLARPALLPDSIAESESSPKAA